MSWYGDWRPYVPVAKRRAKAAAYAKKLAKKERRELVPVKPEGRKIARSFWGHAWCENLERYSDFENRLPRGRTYLRNGSVIDLQIERGRVKAIVSGSEIYRVTVSIKTLPAAHWKRIKHDCSRSFDSLIDLLQGRFDEGVMRRLTEKESGLFPRPEEIAMKCTCPDWAGLCKHVAATLYGVGTRLDAAPELLFTLRDVDHLELIGQAVAAENLDRTLAADPSGELAGSDLSELFGIDLKQTDAAAKKRGGRKRAVASPPSIEAAAKSGRKSARVRKKATEQVVIHNEPHEPAVPHKALSRKAARNQAAPESNAARRGHKPAAVAAAPVDIVPRRASRGTKARGRKTGASAVAE